jgi:AcrR family transcriptional regulator
VSSAEPAAADRSIEPGARDRILAAAVERIASEGIDDVRIARIATDAGVSTSLVHYHFETRDALLEEALEYSYELAGDVRIGEGEGKADDHTQRLAAMVDQCLPYPGMLERDFILWVELWLRASRRPELRPTASRLYARMHDWFRDAIAAGVESGEFRPADPDRVADWALALLDGFGIRVLVGDLPIERARSEAWAMLVVELGVDAEPPRRYGQPRPLSE